MDYRTFWLFHLNQEERNLEGQLEWMKNIKSALVWCESFSNLEEKNARAFKMQGLTNIKRKREKSGPKRGISQERLGRGKGTTNHQV